MQEVRDDLFLKKLGEHIRMLRKQQGMSQLDLAVKMDNFAEQVGRIERGEQNVSICTLVKIASALSIHLSELLDFDY